MKKIEIKETEEALIINGHPIYVSEPLRNALFKEYEINSLDNALSQFNQLSTIPGIISAIGLPDIHAGYFFPIGSVVAVDLDHPGAAISPEGVGFDINCGVRCLRTNLFIDQIIDRKNEIADALFKEIPSGLIFPESPLIDLKFLNQILEKGLQFLFEINQIPEDDLIYTESRGSLQGDSKLICQSAKGRGMNQLGSLGSGNHYLEIQVIEEIYDREKAEVLNIKEGQIIISIHTGSRGLGHQTCSSFMNEFKESMDYKINSAKEKTSKQNREKYNKKTTENNEIGNIKHLDSSNILKEESIINESPVYKKCIKYDSEFGQKYLKMMYSASNFAWANRSLITQKIRKVLGQIFDSVNIENLYDVSHNIAKIEQIQFESGMKRILVHRKGATRVLPPGHEELPEKYKKIGQPVLIGGSMGTCSYIIVGSENSSKTFYSTCHGAGRLLTRSQSKKVFTYEEIVHDLNKKGIVFRCGSDNGLVEESPGCYKDVTEVIEHSDRVGITYKVAKLKPVIVIKG